MYPQSACSRSALLRTVKIVVVIFRQIGRSVLDRADELGVPRAEGRRPRGVNRVDSHESSIREVHLWRKLNRVLFDYSGKTHEEQNIDKQRSKIKRCSCHSLHRFGILAFG